MSGWKVPESIVTKGKGVLTNSRVLTHFIYQACLQCRLGGVDIRNQ